MVDGLEEVRERPRQVLVLKLGERADELLLEGQPALVLGILDLHVGAQSLEEIVEEPQELGVFADKGGLDELRAWSEDRPVGQKRAALVARKRKSRRRDTKGKERADALRAALASSSVTICVSDFQKVANNSSVVPT